jgi:O-methyltransferase
MAGEILSVPPSVEGAVIECGCYKGAGTASLSLICKLAGRKLYACDSFMGLPEDESDAVHSYPVLKATTAYSKGLFAGSLPEVQSNVSHYGDISVCEFIPGFFADSLPLVGGRLVFGFLDVDLVSSMRDCVKHLWPLLVDQGYFYTDDSCDIEVVKMWFDKDFWQREIGCEAPGYIGSGCGLPGLSTSFSSLGYAVKVADPNKSFNPVKFW